MKARLSSRCFLRKEHFGAIAYVQTRDDFFALDEATFAIVRAYSSAWRCVDAALVARVRQLAELGILLTADPPVPETPYSGLHAIGDFTDIPALTQPLVVNCFSTAHCPLMCLYCYADNLMQAERPRERNSTIDEVARMANSLNSIVAVITGGDPITRPDRAIGLIEKIHHDRYLVLDTSGVGDVRPLLQILKDRKIHVRVSLDSVSEENDRVRGVNPLYVKDTRSSRDAALRTIATCLAAELSVTVQTVVSSFNDNYHELVDLRDVLIHYGVRHWVLHLAVNAGKAHELELRRKKSGRGHRRSILSARGGQIAVRSLLDSARSNPCHIDIRCTDRESNHKAVLLIDSIGNLCTEGADGAGKVTIYDASDTDLSDRSDIWIHVDKYAHARRYLNWTGWQFGPGSRFRDFCLRL